MDLLDVGKAVDELTKQTVPALVEGLHGVLDRLNGTRLVMDGTGVTFRLDIPARKEPQNAH